jgi:hypothetical protein
MSETFAQPDAFVIDEAEAAEFVKTVDLAPISGEQASALTSALNHISFVNRGSIQYLPVSFSSQNG